MNEESKKHPDAADQATSQNTNSPVLDPELIRRVVGMLASTNTSDTDVTTEATETTASSDGQVGGNAIASLLSDPALLARLPQIISVMKPLLSTATPPPAPSVSPPTPKSARENNRDRLLLSLKPVLSPARCEAIDTMLRIAQLGDLFGHFQ